MIPSSYEIAGIRGGELPIRLGVVLWFLLRLSCQAATSWISICQVRALRVRREVANSHVLDHA